MAQIMLRDCTGTRAYRYSHYLEKPINVPSTYDDDLIKKVGEENPLADHDIVETAIKAELTNLEGDETDTVNDSNQAANEVRWNF